MWFKYLDMTLMNICETQISLQEVSCLFYLHQLVWNSSYKVGCGVAVCSNVYIYGCHYYRAYVALSSDADAADARSQSLKKLIVFDRGNFKGWIPYTNGSSCASCPGNCEDRLCSKQSRVTRVWNKTQP